MSARRPRPGPVAEIVISGDKAAARQILAAREAFNAALAARDLTVVEAVLGPDCQLVPGDDAQLIAGREAQLDAWRSIFTNMPDVEYVRSPGRIEVADDAQLAAETGRWRGSWSAEGFHIRYHGRYLAKWRHDGERWRIEAEIFVTLKRQG